MEPVWGAKDRKVFSFNTISNLNLVTGADTDIEGDAMRVSSSARWAYLRNLVFGERCALTEFHNRTSVGISSSYSYTINEMKPYRGRVYNKKSITH